MDCTVKLLADDTKLYSVTTTLEDKEKLQNNIYKACDWANKWQMTSNIKKCKTMHIGQNKPIDLFMRDIDNNQYKIQEVDHEKGLYSTKNSSLTYTSKPRSTIPTET